MNGMRKTIRLILINIGVTAGLILFLNFVGTTILIAKKARYASQGDSDSRIALPSVVDKERARQFFSEFRRLQTQYVPFAEWSYEPFSGKAITIGADGRRRLAETAAARAHVHFFGGSTMWGTGAWDAETIPAYAVKQMPGIGAVNHGQSGFVSRQELNALFNLLNSETPVNGIVFYDGVNDVYVLCSVASSENGHGQEVEMQEAMRQHAQGERQILRDMFFGGTLQFAKFLTAKLSPAPGVATSARSCANDSRRAERVAETLWSNWQIARNVASARGIPFLAVLQPVSGFGRPNIAYLPELEIPAAEYQAVYPFLKAKMAAEPDWTLDLSEALDGNERLFIDWSHLVARGNEIIAHRLVERLEPMIRSNSQVSSSAPPASVQ
jgi:hypothetical protein